MTVLSGVENRGSRRVGEVEPVVLGAGRLHVPIAPAAAEVEVAAVEPVAQAEVQGHVAVVDVEAERGVAPRFILDDEAVMVIEAVAADVGEEETRDWGDELRYDIDASQGEVLRGEFLPVRKTAHQVLLSERTSRLRLGLLREGSALRAENGLDADVKELVYRDFDGSWYSTAGELAAGAAALAEANAEAERHAEEAQRAQAQLQQAEQRAHEATQKAADAAKALSAAEASASRSGRPS